MPLNVILEDATGKADANAYVSVEECDAYHLGHLYASAWDGATADQKKAAVVMATRVVDYAVTWKGQRKSDTQALAWPRIQVPRPDAAGITAGQRTGFFWPETPLPKPLKEAVCEMARALLETDRTADPDSAGIASVGLGQGAIEVTFDPATVRKSLTDEAVRMLSLLGAQRGAGGAVKLSRV